jgi:iron-sulfur cluster repair protein YtfE (RIC family)
VLSSLEWKFESIHEVDETEQIALMQSGIEILKDYLLPQLSAEEALLYPEVDRALPPAPGSLTQAMKREHEIMRQWISEMEALSNASMPDRNAFVRRGQRLLGLIEAHFDVEEAVLFPLLDPAAPPIARHGPLRP